MKQEPKDFSSFKEFYPFYLSQRKNINTKRLHFIGCWMVLLLVGFIVGSNQTSFSLLLPVFQYGFAMYGFSKYEKSTPEIFDSPFLNLAGDWVMFKDILIGKIKVI